MIVIGKIALYEVISLEALLTIFLFFNGCLSGFNPPNNMLSVLMHWFSSTNGKCCYIRRKVVTTYVGNYKIISRGVGREWDKREYAGLGSYIRI